MHKLLRFVFSRRFIIVVLALVQLLVFTVLITKFYTIGPTVYFFMTLFSIMVILYLFERDYINPSFQLKWVAVMVMFSITGAVFYFLWGDTKLTKKQQTGPEKIKHNATAHRKDNDYLIDEIANVDKGAAM